MSLAMTREEREAFLADVHVGVVSITDSERGPLAVPIWYAYEPGGELRIVTERGSRKGRLLENGKRLAPDVKVGDRILFGKYSGTEIEIEGEDVLIVREDEVLAIMG